MSPSGAALETMWAAAAARPPSTRFRTTDSGVATPQGAVLIAVRDDGVRHLLVPLDARHTLKEDVEGRAVTLLRRVLEDETALRHYAALALQDEQLVDLFTALCAEVVGRIELTPGKAVTALRRTLDDWRLLLSGARRTLGPAELAGLFGELSVLRDMLAIDPGATNFWTGHSGTAQDFHRGTVGLEVKTTTSPEGRIVRVHGLGQLDGGDAGRLLLVWLRVRTDRGCSVPDLVDDVLALADDERAVLDALRAVGFTLLDREVYALRRFERVERRTYEIGPGFPRVVATGLTDDAALAGIDNVHYDLDLDVAPAVSASIDVEPARAFLEGP